MAVLSPMCQIRSLSLPTRSLPSTKIIDQALSNFQKLGPPSTSKAESIYASLSGLHELQKFIQELILKHLALKILSSHELDVLVKLLEESVTYIDICSKLRDAIISIRQGFQEVQSALRRRGKVSEDLGTEEILKAYISTRKNTEKEIRKSLMNLNHARDNIKKVRVFPLIDFHENCQSAYTMKFLKQASVRTSSILQVLVSFLVVPVSLRKKYSRNWSFVSKFLRKGLVKSEGLKGVDYMNELEEVEVDLSKLLRSEYGEDRIQSVQRKLEAVDSIFEGLEHGVGSLFRGLINMRVSLLNVVSQQYSI